MNSSLVKFVKQLRYHNNFSIPVRLCHAVYRPFSSNNSQTFNNASSKYYD